jgi:hypothetical protein
MAALQASGKCSHIPCMLRTTPFPIGLRLMHTLIYLE